MNEKYFADKALEFKEVRDCGVRALAVATGLTYDEAHAALKKTGRKNRKTTYIGKNVEPALSALGFEMVEEKFPGKTLVTLEKDLKRYARGRRFFVHVRKHFVGFDGDKFVDWAKGKRNRVITCYRVKQVNTAERGTETGRFVSDENPIEETQGEVLDRNVGPIDEGMVPNWLRGMSRPRGAPKKGTRVVQTIANNETFEGEVVDYLSSAFIIRFDTGRERIVGVGDDWAVA